MNKQAHIDYRASAQRPIWILQGSKAKLGWVLSKIFHSFTSKGWHMISSFVSWVECHVICNTVTWEAYNLCNLKVSVKYLSMPYATFLCLGLWTHLPFCLYLANLPNLKNFLCLSSFQNNIHLSLQASTFITSRPKSHINLL